MKLRVLTVCMVLLVAAAPASRPSPDDPMRIFVRGEQQPGNFAGMNGIVHVERRGQLSHLGGTERSRARFSATTSRGKSL